VNIHKVTYFCVINQFRKLSEDTIICRSPGLELMSGLETILKCGSEIVVQV
jgi:hypothetical protein